MRYSTPVLGALGAMALSACVETAPPHPEPPQLVGTCGAPSLQHLVGQHRKVLNTMDFAVPVRIIEPGMAVTMDYVEGRLNILLNEKGVIESVSCG